MIVLLLLRIPGWPEAVTNPDGNEQLDEKEQIVPVPEISPVIILKAHLNRAVRFRPCHVKGKKSGNGPHSSVCPVFLLPFEDKDTDE